MENKEQGGELVPIGVEALQIQAASEREIRTVLDRYGYQGTTLDHLIADTRRMVKESTEAMLEIGRAVCCFRELGRGRYGEAIAAIGLSPATAHRLAEVALKFLGHDHRKPLLTLDRSKVYELALLDERTLDDLAEHPEQLDQIDRMSVSELKKALRELKNTLDAKDAVIKSVQEDNSALREKEIARTCYTPDQAQQDVAEKRRARMAAVQSSALQILTAVNDFGLVLQSSREHGDADEQEYGTQTAAWLAQQVSNLYLTFGIGVDFDEIITPSWTRQPTDTQ
ncbi:MAG: hypothetical protein ABTS16_21225 [Candidatus Accumulibacter phosphatis]